MARKMTDFTLYRWRYIIGYTGLAILLTGLLFMATIYFPGGLSKQEISSVVRSDATSLQSFSARDIINLPYSLLQHGSIKLFGMSLLGIKLPSLILGLGSIVGMIILLRMWFRDNVTILATILMATIGQFLYVSQSGTSQILYIFWSIWLLTTAMMISRKARFGFFWKIALFVTAALSLYTPLSIYLLIALGSAMALHPHLRFIVRRLSKIRLLLGAAFGAVLLLPLLYSLYKDPLIGLQLVGVPSELPPLMSNVSQLLSQYFNFTAQSAETSITPVYGLPIMLLIGLGLYQHFSTKYTARSYILSIWVLLLMGVIILNPNFITITVVPVVLLIAMGINLLFSQWYRLFPLNPYARAAGLLPLTVLAISLVTSNVGRYAYSYHYDPQIASNFSSDLRLLNKIKSQQNDGTITLVTSGQESQFYKVVAKYDPAVSLKENNKKTLPEESIVVVTRQAHDDNTYSTQQPSEVVTNSLSHDANRFYVYKSGSK